MPPNDGSTETGADMQTATEVQPDRVDAPPDMAAEAAVDVPPEVAPEVSPDRPPLVSPAGQDIVSGAGRLTGATYTMEVTLGHAVGQYQMQGATYRLEANTPIKP